MQRFTFDDEDDSIKDTRRENSIQQEEKEPEVKKVVKTLAFGVRFYLDDPETVKQWFWQGYRYLFR